MKKLSKRLPVLDLICTILEIMLACVQLMPILISAAFPPPVQKDNTVYSFFCSTKQEVTADGTIYLYDFMINGNISPFQVTPMPYLRISDPRSDKTLLVLFSNVFTEAPVSSNDGHCIVCSYIDLREIEQAMIERLKLLSNTDIRIEVNVLARFDFSVCNVPETAYVIIDDGMAVICDDSIETCFSSATIIEQDLLLYPEHQALIINTINSRWKELQ